MNAAVTLIPKPATKQLWWLPACTGKQEVYPRVLSFSMLPVSKGLIPYLKNFCGFLQKWLVYAPKPLCSFVSDPALLIGGMGCLCVNNHRHLTGS